MPKSKSDSNRGARSKPSHRLKGPAVAEKQSDRLVDNCRHPKSLVEFFRQSPLVGVDLDLERDRGPSK